MTPAIDNYDWILISSSAGKDSQAMLDYVVELARAAGVLERVVVVHCDLGRVEWAGTRELAERQARHYGVRFEVVSRNQGDLLVQVEQRHESLKRRGKVAPPWPSPVNRWCTSDQKRAPIQRVMTMLSDEFRHRVDKVRHAGEPRRPVRILSCIGQRADESPKRAKMAPFERDQAASNGRREVDTWRPIHAWHVDAVWARNRAAGTPHHPAYDKGMGRLSCVLCIYAPEKQLLLAAEHNRGLLDEYIGVEDRTGYQFRQDVSLVQIRRRLEAGERGGPDDAGGCWNM